VIYLFSKCIILLIVWINFLDDCDGIFMGHYPKCSNNLSWKKQ